MTPPTALPTPTAQGMLCPVCQVNLVMSDRMGIEIDYCPKCRGVWLDRGELDKIIERSLTEAPMAAARPLQPAPPPMQPSGYAPGYPGGHGDSHGGGHHGGGHGGSHASKHGGSHSRSYGSGHHRSFLGRLFD